MPVGILDAMNFGTEHEQIIIDRMMAEGEWVPLGQKELRQYGTVDSTGQLKGELKVAGGKIVIRCHPDGIVQHAETGERRVLEVKCMAEGNPPWDKPFYQWQTSVEAAITKLPILMVVGWKVPDVENNEQRVLKDGPPEIREMDPTYGLGKIKARAMQIVREVEKGEVPETCDQNDYPCPFYLTHPDRDVEDWVEVEEDGDVIANLAREMDLWNAEQKKAKKQYEVARDALKDRLKQGKWKAGGWKVMVTTTHHEAKVVEKKAYDTTTVKVEKETE